MRKNKSVVYANYTPYENSGHILDFLKENFSDVYLFSIGFHNLGDSVKYNKLTHYHNGRRKNEKNFYYMHVPQSLVFVLYPVRSTMNMLQIIYETYLIYKKRKAVDVFFSVNAFVVWIGMFLKVFGIVKKTVFWVWDYYPVKSES